MRRVFRFVVNFIEYILLQIQTQQRVILKLVRIKNSFTTCESLHVSITITVDNKSCGITLVLVSLF